MKKLNNSINANKPCDNPSIQNQLEKDAKEYMTKEKIPHRCKERNGKKFMVTCDVRMDRVTYIVTDDKVSSYVYG
jgi:hypothetical protein